MQNGTFGLIEISPQHPFQLITHSGIRGIGYEIAPFVRDVDTGDLGHRRKQVDVPAELVPAQSSDDSARGPSNEAGDTAWARASPYAIFSHPEVES